MRYNIENMLAQVAPSTSLPAAGTTEAPAVKDATAAGAGQPPNMGLMTWMPIILIAVFYIFLLRPHAKKEKERKKSLEKLSKGDRVVTRGGMIGTVANIMEAKQTVVVKISDTTKVEVLKNAIDQINPDLKAEAVEKK